jgi:beta-carotene hydroxylase
MLRSGRAYRLAHLNHHARYPDAADDPEAAAAHGGLFAALAGGPLFFPRLWWWAVRRHPNHRTRLVLEGGAVAVLAAGAGAAAWTGTAAPLVYVVLVYLGTWVVPLVTAYVPHTPAGAGPLTQTRRFRGRLVRLIALDHLYHLEHHLYPAVPHHRWPELARRLDPHLDRAGVPAVRPGG